MVSSAVVCARCKLHQHAQQYLQAASVTESYSAVALPTRTAQKFRDYQSTQHLNADYAHVIT
jgi:hypothetical protein